MHISIHAAREGGDPDGQEIADFFGISIHAAREGGDVSCPCGYKCRNRFQSTPPMKAATSWAQMGLYTWGISIHAAREGGDPSR